MVDQLDNGAFNSIMNGGEPAAPAEPSAPVEDVIIDTSVDNAPETPAASAGSPEPLPGFVDVRSLGFEDEVQLRSALGRVVTDEDHSRLQALRQGEEELQRVKTQLDEFKQQSPYKNPLFFQLEVFSEQNPDKAELAKAVMLGTPTPLQIIKMDMLNKHPELKDSPEVIERKIQRTYPDAFKEDADDEAYKAAMDDMRMDATTITRGVQAAVKAIEVPTLDSVIKQRDQKIEQLLTSWTPFFQKLPNETTSFSVSHKSGNEVAEVVKLEIPKADAIRYAKQALDAVASGNLEASQQNEAKVREFVRNAYILENFQKIISDVIIEVQKDTTGKFRQRVSNNSRVPGAPAAQNGNLDDRDMLWNRVNQK